jgi:hypothetical protein
MCHVAAKSKNRDVMAKIGDAGQLVGRDESIVQLATKTRDMVAWIRAVLRIRDVYPGSRTLIVFYPVSGSNNNKKRKKIK